MGTTSTSPSTFTGQSSFAADLGQVITRAVGIASLPMQNLQIQQGTLQSQQSELQTLSGNFMSLATALSSINSSTGSQSWSASVADGTVASASVSSGVRAGTYSINVTSIGSNSTAMSANGLTAVTDPSKSSISTSTTFKLMLNTTEFDLTPADNTLNGLVNAINSSGSGVQATVVNIGSSSAPDYRLSVQSGNFAPDGLQLLDSGGTNLLGAAVPGTYVQYQVNGQPATPINSSSRTLNLSTGLTVNLLKAGTTTVTVSQNGASIANALSSFVNSYNNALAEVQKSRGQNGGALAGDSSIYTLTEALRNMTSYTAGSGSVTSITDLGLTFDQNGNLNFDSTKLSSAVKANPTDVLNFLGSASGGGFLGAANGILTSINDSTNGVLPQTIQTISTRISTMTSQINDDQDQINQLQANLQKQLAAADAAIASLEQQASYFQQMYQTQNANAQLGY